MLNVYLLSIKYVQCVFMVNQAPIGQMPLLINLK